MPQGQGLIIPKVPIGGKRHRTRVRKQRVKRKTYTRKNKRRVRPTKKRRVKRAQRKTKNRRRRQRGGLEPFTPGTGQENNGADKATKNALQKANEQYDILQNQWDEYVYKFVNNPGTIRDAMTTARKMKVENVEEDALKAELRKQLEDFVRARVADEKARFQKAKAAADTKTGATKMSASAVGAWVADKTGVGASSPAVRGHNDRHALRERVIREATKYGVNNEKTRAAAEKYLAFDAAVKVQTMKGPAVGLLPVIREAIIEAAIKAVLFRRVKEKLSKEEAERLVANRTLGDVKENAKADALRRAIEETKKGEAVLDKDVTDGSYKTKTGGRRKKRSTSRTRHRSASTTRKKLGRKNRSRKR